MSSAGFTFLLITFVCITILFHTVLYLSVPCMTVKKCFKPARDVMADLVNVNLDGLKFAEREK